MSNRLWCGCCDSDIIGELCPVIHTRNTDGSCGTGGVGCWDDWDNGPSGDSNIVNAGQTTTTSVAGFTDSSIVMFEVLDIFATLYDEEDAAFGASWSNGYSTASVIDYAGGVYLLIDAIDCAVVEIGSPFKIYMWHESGTDVGGDYVDAHIEVYNAAGSLIASNCRRLRRDATTLGLSVSGGTVRPIEMGHIDVYESGVENANCSRRPCSPNPINTQKLYVTTAVRQSITGLTDSTFREDSTQPTSDGMGGCTTAVNYGEESFANSEINGTYYTSLHLKVGASYNLLTAAEEAAILAKIDNLDCWGSTLSNYFWKFTDAPRDQLVTREGDYSGVLGSFTVQEAPKQFSFVDPVSGELIQRVAVNLADVGTSQVYPLLSSTPPASSTTTNLSTVNGTIVTGTRSSSTAIGGACPGTRESETTVSASSTGGAQHQLTVEFYTV